MSFRHVNKVVGVLLSLALLSSVVASPAIAAGQGANGATAESTVANPTIDIKTISVDEVRVTVNNNGRLLEAVITKDAQNVSSHFYLDKKLVQVDKRNLRDATARGEAIKKDSAVISRPYLQSGEGTIGTSGIDPNPNPGLPAGDYYFDAVAYSPRGQYQPYAHPDKNYYGISPYTTWSRSGAINAHIQVNQYNSNSIVQMPAWAISGGLGALVGGLVSGNLGGAVIGAIIGGALGAYFGGQATRILDENGCIWLVMDRNPPMVNLGSWLTPQWFIQVRYISVGPWSRTNYLYPIP